MSHLRQMTERRAAIRNEMQTMLADAGESDLAGEAAQRWDSLRAEAEGLETRISRQAFVDDMDRRAAGTPLGSGDARFDAEVRAFSIVRAIAARSGIEGIDAGREREVSAELSRRSGVAPRGILIPVEAVFARAPGMEHRASNTTTGAAMIQTDVDMAGFIDRLRPASVVARAGATILPGLSGNLAVPRRTSSPGTAWVADGSALTPADGGFDQVTLSPKTVGAITEYSRGLLLQTSGAVEQVVRDDLAKGIGQAIDSAAIAGSGSAPTPLGILSTTGIGSVAIGTNGGALTYAAVQDLRGQVADTNAEVGTMAFVSNTKVRRAIAKMVDGMQRPLGEDVVMAGLPRMWSNNVPSNGTKGTGTGLSALVYGDWSACFVGVWSALDILVNPFGDAYARGGVQVRAMASVDVALRHPESFAAIQDIVA